jgi:hypothetical protein
MASLEARIRNLPTNPESMTPLVITSVLPSSAAEPRGE